MKEYTKNIENLKNADITLIDTFLENIEADLFFRSLENNVDWEQQSMNMYGKEYKFARLTSWYGESNTSYKFSGVTLNAHDWNKSKDLLYIKDKINNICNEDFNSVLLNLYRDGNDYISWHSDNEKELGINPTIASLSLGASRIFRIRRMDNHSIKYDIELRHGSLLIMKGETQHHWEHTIPRRSDNKLSLFDKSNEIKRINLTFRKM